MPPCDGFAGYNSPGRPVPRVEFLIKVTDSSLPELVSVTILAKVTILVTKVTILVILRRVRGKAGPSVINGKSGSRSGVKGGPEVVSFRGVRRACSRGVGRTVPRVVYWYYPALYRPVLHLPGTPCCATVTLVRCTDVSNVSSVQQEQE